MRTPERWLWVTRPKYYLDENGQDSAALEPDVGFVADGWWTCDPKTKEGDLVLLYRAGQRKDISHFLVVRSDAERLDDPESEFNGAHVCQYEVLEKFDRPLPFAELAADPVLGGWHPVRIRMQGRAFPISSAVWPRLEESLQADFGGLAAKATDGLQRVRREREIESRIMKQPRLLDSIGLTGLTLERNQYYLPDGRIADLVYRRGRGLLSHLVVIELKKIKAGRRAVEQVVLYREEFDKLRHRGQRRTRAVLIADGITRDAERAAAEHDVRFIPLSALKVVVSQRSADR